MIHRDLKPGNIFVTTSGEKEGGAVKLLDFGIAKILDPSLRAGALSLTHTGLCAMTPEYASPEQIRGETITTASDVYSLGVTLYELLTGVHPFRFKTRVLHEMTRTVCEDEPVRPSLVRSPGFSRNDSELPPEGGATNARRLRGDLDNIILKARRKEPAQRYASVEQLSEDIRRHLEGRFVIARKGSAGYLARKFIRRHKAGVAGITFLALALLAGWFLIARRARVAEERTRENRRQLYPVQMAQASEDWERGNIARVFQRWSIAGYRWKEPLEIVGMARPVGVHICQRKWR